MTQTKAGRDNWRRGQLLDKLELAKSCFRQIYESEFIPPELLGKALVMANEAHRLASELSTLIRKG